MKKLFCLSLSFFIAFFAISCKYGVDAVNTDEAGFGSITVSTKAVSDSARMLNKADITGADIVVSGYGMEDITSSASLSNGASSSSVTISKIPAGKNRVVKVTATNDSQLVMYAVVDIESQKTASVLVNWDSTALGGVYYNLIKTYSYDVSSVSTSTVKEKIPSVSHASLVDTLAIAKLIAKNTSSSDYVISPASVTFTTNIADSNACISVSDPSSSSLSGASALSQSITDITPGTWIFCVTSNSSVKYTKTLTLTEGQTLDLGTITIGTSLLTSEKSTVILQGFNWDSAPRGQKSYWGKWYDIMASNGSTIGSTFDYVWCPPPCMTNTSSSEGYGPTQWFDLNNCYGTETQLKNMISAISPAKAVADVVVNHRDGATSWGDFTNPTLGTVKGSDYRAICSDDEGFTSESAYMGASSTSMRGASDTGASYAASRDLDHTYTLVQEGVKDYLTLLKNAGFVGWRYDFVKGFDGYYVGMYNKASSPEIAFGEYWPGTDDGGGYFSSSNPSSWANKISSWINRTNDGGYKTKAFDFVLKGMMNDIWGCSWGDGSSSASNNYSLLASTSTLVRSQPAYAVTFVDNHDTGSTQGHWKLPDSAVPAAYAYILTHPGIPCVAWQHYFTYAESGNSSSAGSSQYIAENNAGSLEGSSATLRQLIDRLIELRKELAIEYDSALSILSSSSSCYAAEITGLNGSFLVSIGSSTYSNVSSDYTEVASGTNYKIWQKGAAASTKTASPVIKISSSGSVSITCSTDGASIYYSTDSKNYTLYSSAFTVSEGTSVYAYASSTGLEDSSVVSKTYTVGITITVTADSWTWNGSCNVFAWVWNDSATGQWIECSGSSSTVTFELPSDCTYFLLVRCPSATTTPDWKATGDSAGRIYNKTDDIKVVSGTTSYSASFSDYSYTAS